MFQDLMPHRGQIYQDSSLAACSRDVEVLAGASELPVDMAVDVRHRAAPRDHVQDCPTSGVTVQQSDVEDAERRRMRDEYGLLVDEWRQLQQVASDPFFRLLVDAAHEGWAELVPTMLNPPNSIRRP